MSHAHGHQHHHAHSHHHAHVPERAAHHHGTHAQHPASGGPRLDAHASGSPAEVAGYLSALADGLRTGGITIRSGGRAVGLRLDGDVTLELRASAGESGVARLGLELSWTAPQVPAPMPQLEILPTQDAARQSADRGGETSDPGSVGLDEASGSAPTDMTG